MDIKKIIFQSLSNLGIILNTENALLEEIIEDSVMFISFIVELEQNFDIEIPDEYLNMETLATIDDVYNMIMDIKG